MKQVQTHLCVEGLMIEILEYGNKHIFLTMNRSNDEQYKLTITVKYENTSGM